MRPIIACQAAETAETAAVCKLDATGTRRRLRALGCMGHGPAVLAGRLGCTADVVRRVCTGNATRSGIVWVTPAFASAVRVQYDVLADVLGDAALAARSRKRAGWAPPVAWDDQPGDPHFIDDPDCPVSNWRMARARTPAQLRAGAAVLAKVRLRRGGLAIAS